MGPDGPQPGPVPRRGGVATPSQDLAELLREPYTPDYRAAVRADLLMIDPEKSE